jgi:intracellular sulfur oxidation DsrE/DsrF family protein
MKILKYKIFTLIAALMLCGTALASTSAIDDSAALGNLKTGKAVFLIDIGEPKKLNFYLEVIQGTHKGMKSQGVTPDFILVYIGPSVKYLTSTPSVETEKLASGVLMDIESNIEALAQLGIKQEICAVATRVFDIDNKTVFPDLTLVADGFISLIGYQAQGYHLVPVF